MRVLRFDLLGIHQFAEHAKLVNTVVVIDWRLLRRRPCLAAQAVLELTDAGSGHPDQLTHVARRETRGSELGGGRAGRGRHLAPKCLGLFPLPGKVADLDIDSRRKSDLILDVGAGSRQIVNFQVDRQEASSMGFGDGERAPERGDVGVNELANPAPSIELVRRPVGRHFTDSSPFP
jgi:hypothetical protein